MNNDREGFFRRWSNRKAESRLDSVIPPESPRHSPMRDTSEPAPAPDIPRPHDEPLVTPVPTLQDVERLTPGSDFSDFVRHPVPPEVKNAAMKKLFADPHFNVMDGLDVYIDDYSQPDPLAPSMLRQMVSAQFMNLVDESPAHQLASPTGDAPSNVLSESVTACATSLPIPSTEDHDHADLRLQPDPDVGPEVAGSSSA